MSEGRWASPAEPVENLIKHQRKNTLGCTHRRRAVRSGLTAPAGCKHKTLVFPRRVSVERLGTALDLQDKVFSRFRRRERGHVTRPGRPEQRRAGESWERQAFC